MQGNFHFDTNSKVLFFTEDQMFSLYRKALFLLHAKQVCVEIALQNIDSDVTQNSHFCEWYEKSVEYAAEYFIELKRYGIVDAEYIDFSRAAAGNKEEVLKYPILYAFDNYNEIIGKVFGGETNNTPLTLTLQVTEDCNLACSYCYQHAKTSKKLTFDQAKQFFDDILYNTGKLSPHYDALKYRTCTLEFIGGEPFLEIDLIDKCTDYFVNKMIELNHPWLHLFMISISSNGTLWEDDRVKSYVRKHQSKLSLGITVDGTKELHDKCRRFPDGRPSYDLAHKAAMDLKDETGVALTKITLHPSNIMYFSECIKQMCIDNYDIIHANFVFEDVWQDTDCVVYYKQVKDLTEWLIQNKKVNFYCDQIFRECKPYEEERKEINWCGGTGSMLCLSPDGVYYPCLRYAPSSVGSNAVPYSLGTVTEGIASTPVTKERLEALKAVNTGSQSDNTCMECQVSDTCGWCSAFNYECYHTVNKRTTYICDMHKTRALSTCYLNNSMCLNGLKHKPFDIRLPKDECVRLIGTDEYMELCEITKKAGGNIIC